MKKKVMIQASFKTSCTWQTTPNNRIQIKNLKIIPSFLSRINVNRTPGIIKQQKQTRNVEILDF